MKKKKDEYMLTTTGRLVVGYPSLGKIWIFSKKETNILRKLLR